MTQLQALLLTVAIEVPAVMALVWLLGSSWAPRLVRVEYVSGQVTLVATAAAASLLTHPFAWWANTELLRGRLPFMERATVIELSVIGAEALLYAWLLGLEPGAALLVAAVANGLSFGLGLWLYWNVF